MTFTIPIETIQLTPGSQISIPNLSWQDFETILTELGEQRSTRLAYYRGTLELMSPLARHERPHRIIADIIKAILEIQERDWEDFGSTTFKRPEIGGVEPDTCFYIQNASQRLRLPKRKAPALTVGQVRGCTNIDLTVHSPPDLAIESDVTSITTLNAYEVLRVPEVWIYYQNQLTIYVLHESSYVKTAVSPTFPTNAITEIIPPLVQKAINEGTSKMLREFKAQFR